MVTKLEPFRAIDRARCQKIKETFFDLIKPMKTARILQLGCWGHAAIRGKGL